MVLLSQFAQSELSLTKYHIKKRLSIAKSEFLKIFLYFLANIMYHVRREKEVEQVKGLGNSKILGKNLRRYIDMSGKSDKDIADAIGVAPASVSEWMSGKKYPRIDNIEKLAAYFHIQKSDLIEEKDQTSEYVPQTREAKLLCRGIDSMPLEERERAANMFKLMFSKYANCFEERNEDDAT